MIKRIIYIMIGIIVMVSCRLETSYDSNNETAIEASQDVQISRIGITLSQDARALTDSWSKYQILKSKIESYNKITTSEALLNAKDLSDIVVDVSDTIDIKLFDRSDMKVRFNVLNNHALRLDDMSTISSISDEEVKFEVSKILNSFSSINEKINTLVKIDNFNIESGDSGIVMNDKIGEIVGKDVKKIATRKPTQKMREERKKMKTLQKGKINNKEILIKKREKRKE